MTLCDTDETRHLVAKKRGVANSTQLSYGQIDELCDVFLIHCIFKACIDITSHSMSGKK